MITEDKTLTIAKNGTISDYVQIRGSYVGIKVPTIDTAVCYLQGAVDKDGTKSARIQKEDGSEALNLASGTGGVLWTIPFKIPFRWVAVETSAAQTTAARIFGIIVKD